MPSVTPGSDPARSGPDLAILAELLAEMSRSRTIDEIVACLARSTKWLVASDTIALLLCDSDGRTWHLYPGGTSGRSSMLPRQVKHALQHNVSHTLTRETDAVADAMTSQLSGTGWHAALGLPLSGSEGTFGTLNIGSNRPDAFPARPPMVVELLRMNVAAVVQNVQRLSQAEKLSELRSRLVANVSHDYKGPLAAILGFSDLMISYEYSRDKQIDMLSLVRSETLRLSELVNEVLDLSALTLQGGDVRRIPLDLPSTIEYCLSTYGTDESGRTNHTFEVDVAADLPTTYGDPSRITQVLMNLIGNAVKYSPAGGEIVTTIRSSPDGQEVQVAVSDRGMGMDPQEIGKLFQPFERATTAVNSGIEGTGLGLAICREIVQAHGGRLWAESDGPGLGSTFILALPTGDVSAESDPVAAISA